MPRIRILAAALALPLYGASFASAQVCGDPEWIAMGDGLDGQINAIIEWDPDGAGPQDPILIAGGHFTTAGGTAAASLAQWDGTNWSQFSWGTDGFVNAMEILPNGDLIITGSFSQVGPDVIYNIARFDGVFWHPLGAGINNQGRAIAVMPNGDLIVGGDISTAGVDAIDNIARWDGTNWSPIVSAGSFWAGANSRVRALAVMPNGDLVAGGNFYDIDGVSAPKVARWNGSNWSDIGGSFPGISNTCHALAVMPNGDLVAGGFITEASGAEMDGLVRWDGVSWTSMGIGFYSCRALLLRSNGDLVVGGTLDFAGGLFNGVGIVSWDGAQWNPLPDGIPGAVLAITEQANGDLIAGGLLISTGTTTGNVTRWTPSQLPSFVTPYPKSITVWVQSDRSVTYAWQIEDPSNPGDWLYLSDGTFPGLGEITGSNIPSLTISDVNGSAAVRCEISNICGSVTSPPEYINIRDTQPCTVDFNNDGFLDSGDIQMFVALFLAGC